MKAMYFNLRNNDTGNNVGTVRAKTDEELAEKIKLACEEHFNSDPDTLTVSDVEMDDVKYGRSKDLTITYKTDGDDDEIVSSVEITQTWLY